MRLWNKVSVIAFFGSVLGLKFYNSPVKDVPSCEDKAKIYEFIETGNYSINSGKV